MNPAVLGLLFLLTGSCTEHPAGQPTVATPGRLPISIWGGSAGQLSVETDGAVFEGLCVSGRIDQPIEVDSSGSFDVPGTLRQAGGANRGDDEPAAVRFSGRVEGNAMELWIQHSSQETKSAPIELKKGTRGSPRPCP